MQDYDERYCWILGHRTGKAFVSLQKLTQTRTSLLVPCLLGGPDVLGECTSSAAHDVTQPPGQHPLLGSNRQWQTGAHTQYNPVPILHVHRPECADESAGPFLLPPDDFRQTLQWRSQISKSRFASCRHHSLELFHIPPEGRIRPGARGDSKRLLRRA